MWKRKTKSIDEARRDYAMRQAEAAEWDDPRLEQAFAETPREDFLPDPPWLIIEPGLAVMRRSSEPADLYEDVLVAIDPAKGINNGEPMLHAGWMGQIRPRPGETVVHVGAGTGYYSAILARLVAPGGEVIGYEVEEEIAAAGARNLEAIANADISHADAVFHAIPDCNIIYVNAGVVAPPARWLEALKPGGRLVFPWRPASNVGLAMLIRRVAGGYAATSFSSAWFIPCIGASDEAVTLRTPSKAVAAATRSVFLSREREPDETATAIYEDLWFSSAELA